MAGKDKLEGMEILKKRGYSEFIRLDSGGQGNVYKTSKNKVLYAAKVVHIEGIDKKLDDDLQRELTIIKNVKHPNCIQVQDIFRTKHKVFIIMDFMPNKCIGDEVDKKGSGLCEWKSKVYFSQIACAIKYLHEHSVAHRDLKLENVLLDQHFNAKVCDFGFSKFVTKDPKTGKLKKSETFVGTPSYEPPEVMSNTPYDPFKCDIWCMGVCLFVMVNYEFPFNTDEPKQKRYQKQMKRMYRYEPKVEASLSANAKDLIKRLMEPEINNRMNVNDVLKHPWIPNTLHP